MVFSVFDLDSLFKPQWTEALGRRVFPFEAFLSHNRFDESGEVAVELRRRGVAVWHDAHADMADREVRSKVAKAIRASRYLVVCVGCDFRDSPWVRAEYLPALETQRRAGGTRVVVLTMHDGAPIPGDLAGERRFAIADLDALGRFLLDGNMTSDDPADAIARANAHVESARAAAVIPRRADGADWKLEIDQFHEALAEMESEGGADRFSRLAMLIRNVLCQEPEMLPARSLDVGRFLRWFSIRLARSGDSDNRANGLMLLHALDKRWQERDTLADLLSCLCLETDAAIAAEGLWHLSSMLPRLEPGDRAAMTVVALRSSDLLDRPEYSEFIAALPEPVRCLVLQEEGLGELTATESLQLIRERLDFVLGQGPSFARALESAAPLFAITDLEIVVRDTGKVLRAARRDAEAPASTALLEEALSIFEIAAKPSSPRHGAALLAMQEFVLDLMLFPLLRMRSSPELWPRARAAAEQACDALAGAEKIAREIPIYRMLIAEVDAGAEPHAAWRRLWIKSYE